MAALTTYRDLIDHVLDYLGASSSVENTRAARRAVLAAYREYSNGHRWSYYYQRGRTATVAHQTEGTIAYDHTGGAFERLVTLTGSTWPSWAAAGTLRIGQISYEVDELKTSTTLTLLSTSNPGADVAALTEYTLYRDTYSLPTDFLAMDEAILAGQSRVLTYERPGEWLERGRIVSGPATPHCYTFTGDPDTFGGMAIRLFPPPDNAYELDYLYQRQPRPLLIDEYSTGTVSCTSASATLTGSGTTWTSAHVGSAVLLSPNALRLPTGLAGENPYAMLRRILAVGSATSITLDAVADQTLSGVKYAISDPVDVEQGAMLTGLLRELEKQVRVLKRMKATPEEAAEHQRAMFAAWEADARSFQPRAAGSRGVYRQRFADMPYDSGV